MGTNASNPGPYASVDDALARYDVRLWGDLCGDAGTRYTAAQLADRSILAGQRLYALLCDASADVEMACLRGGRYTAEDLATLQGMALTGLIRLVVNRAMILGMRARDPSRPTGDLTKETDATLKQLELGEAIFGIQEVADAGAGMDTVDQPGHSTEPRVPTSVLAERMFGRRGYSYPECRGRRG